MCLLTVCYTMYTNSLCHILATGLQSITLDCSAVARIYIQLTVCEMTIELKAIKSYFNTALN
jgi:hypothetical protein